MLVLSQNKHISGGKILDSFSSPVRGFRGECSEGGDSAVDVADLSGTSFRRLVLVNLE